MDPREKLANHLAPHGVQMDVIGGRGTADIADILTGLDYAAACALIGPRFTGMLYAQILRDGQEERKVRSWWLMESIEYGAAKGWRRPKARMIQGFAYATMDEHLRKNTICDACNGTQSREIDRRIVECPKCGGVGSIEYGPALYADRIGCTMLEWDKAWRERVGWARRALYRWETDAAEALLEKTGY